MKRVVIFCIQYLLLSTCCWAQEFQNTFKLSNVSTVPSENKFTSFRVSPKRDKVLFVEDSTNAFYFAKARDIKAIGISNEKMPPAEVLSFENSNIVSGDTLMGFDPVWSDDNKSLNFKDLNQALCVDCYSHATVSNKGKVSRMEANHLDTTLNENLFLKFNIEDVYIKENQTVAYYNRKSRQIEAFKALNPERTWTLSNEKGIYFNLILSPDSKKVVCNKGSEMIVYGTNPDDKTLTNLGVGIPTGWDPTSKYILYYLEEGDGHTNTDASIYIVDLTGGNRSILSKKDGMIFTNPTWLGEDKILFNEESRGDILVGQIKHN
jgi:hypothetical protein